METRREARDKAHAVPCARCEAAEPLTMDPDASR